MNRTKKADQTVRTDLDETRRLLYMCLVASRTKRYNLVGTVVHALIHHQHIDTPEEEVIERVIALVDGHEVVASDHRAWLDGQIMRTIDAAGDMPNPQD